MALALAVAVSGVWLLSLDSHLTFIADDWELLVRRQGSGAAYFLDSFHGNILVGPALAYKLLLALFGMGSATPFFAVSIALFLTSAVLLFVYLRRRVGDWLALIAAVLLLFLGAAFEDLLWVFQIGYFSSVAAGLGMLIALDRGDERGDRVACALLVVSLAFSSVGLAFAAGALADLAFGRRPWRPRAYVALLPAALCGLWWLGWGLGGESHVGLHNLVRTPKFVFDSASAGIVSLLGLASNDGSEPSQPHMVWGRLVLLVALCLLVFRIHREGRVSRGMAVALAIGLSLWFLTGLNRDADRLPTSSRYQYPSAVALLLIGGELLRGLRPPRAAIVAAAAVAGLAISGGVALAQREYRERWRPASDGLRTALAAVDLAGARAEPGFRIAFAPKPVIAAPVYLRVAAEYGSPAWSEAGLAARPQAEREAADPILAQAEGLRLLAPEPAQRAVACQRLRASAGTEAQLTLLHGGFTLSNLGGAPVEVLLGRFAPGLPVDLGALPPGQTAALSIPVDSSGRPWALGLRGSGRVRLCTTTTA